MTGAVDRLRRWVPRWWRGEAGWLGSAADAALAPAEALFRFASRGRNHGYDLGWLRVERAPIPIVSVGNIGVGGAGKTPVSAWIAGRLLGWGESPAIVLRGYGRDEVEVHRELNPQIPVIAAPRRASGAREAATRACTVAVLDDGFQHRALYRDLDLVLVAVEGWGARRRLLPRGPWREEPSALRRAAIVMLTRKSASPEQAETLEREIGVFAGEVPIVRCHLAPGGLRPLHEPGGAPLELSSLRGRRVLAVATLADPLPFQAQIRGAGAEVELATYPDHHELGPQEARHLLARAAGRTLVMTRKEAVKLRSLLDAAVPALVLDQTPVIESGAEALDAALREAVGR